MSKRSWLVAGVALLGLAAAGLAGAALLAWPRVAFAGSQEGLAWVKLPAFAGRVASVDASTAAGVPVPVRLRGRTVAPMRPLPAGVLLSVSVTVQRPSWIGWLVGSRESRSLTVVTPRVHVVDRWPRPEPGAAVSVRFDRAVRVVSIDGRVRRLAAPRKIVPIGVAARGPHRAGTVKVAAAVRPWEQLAAPVRVVWFVPRRRVELLAEPKPGATISPDRPLTLVFSRPVRQVMGSRRPRLEPAVPGRWRLRDAHTLVFEPSGLGFGLGAAVRVRLPHTALLVRNDGSKPRRVLGWKVHPGSLLRLQQLLARLGYLPLEWRPETDPPDSARAELAAAVAPPAGRFGWRYPHTPAPLKALWRPGRLNEITRAAIMTFEDAHGLPVDAAPSPKLWRTVVADALAGRRRRGGYSYVFVHRTVPQSLNLWHNGRVIVRSPGNTGVPAAPTELGTWPVFEHIPVGTMSGTNLDGSHYYDPGIQYISYFHGGDAIHAFPRPSYGTPQSLGCVELPFDAAAKVWPYTPIGTLVTIED